MNMLVRLTNLLTVMQQQYSDKRVLGLLFSPTSSVYNPIFREGGNIPTRRLYNCSRESPFHWAFFFIPSSFSPQIGSHSLLLKHMLWYNLFNPY